MLEYVEKLFVQYRSKGILIDANLLLLYFVGSYDPRLVGRFKRIQKEMCLRVFSHLVPAFDEFYKPARDLSTHMHFPRFGLTDTAIADLAPDRYLVLTDDLPLYHYLSETGVDAINFNHIRTLNWQN